VPIGDKARTREFLDREEDDRLVVRDKEGRDNDRPEVVLSSFDEWGGQTKGKTHWWPNAGVAPLPSGEAGGSAHHTSVLLVGTHHAHDTSDYRTIVANHAASNNRSEDDQLLLGPG
jgi:hypothetical protein